MIFRRKNTVGKIPVVGDKHKTRCGNIKPSGGEKIASLIFVRNKVDNGFIPAVVRCADNAFRLVEHQIDEFFKLHFLSVDAYKTG